MRLLVGLGNRYRSDDGAGLEVARRLRESGLEGTAVLELSGEPIGLLDRWAEAGRVVAVDAVSSAAKPGTVHRFDARARPLAAELFRGSTHAIGLAEAIELGRELDRLPDELLAYGIEGERFGMGEGLSEPVGAAVERVVAELRVELAAAV